MAAQHHAQRGVDHLGVQAVALLGLDARQRIPAAGRQLVEGGPGDEVLLGLVLEAGAGEQPDRGGTRQVTHPVGVVTVRVAHDAGRRVAVFGLDEIDVTVGRLDDVRVRGNASQIHVRSSCPYRYMWGRGSVAPTCGRRGRRSFVTMHPWSHCPRASLMPSRPPEAACPSASAGTRP